MPLAFAPQKVEFFQNKKKIGEVTFPPYGLDWTPPKGGKYTLTAKVTDGRRFRGISPGVKISVIQPLAIVTQPLAQSVVPGATATFKVSVSGTAPISYQWLRDGLPVTNAVKSVLTLRRVQTNVLGNYSVRVTNPAGSVVSNPVALTFKP